MLSMVRGRRVRAESARRLTFLFEPARPWPRRSSTTPRACRSSRSAQTLYAFAAILLVSSAFLSFAGCRRRSASDPPLTTMREPDPSARSPSCAAPGTAAWRCATGSGSLGIGMLLA